MKFIHYVTRLNSSFLYCFSSSSSTSLLFTPPSSHKMSWKIYIMLAKYVENIENDLLKIYAEFANIRAKGSNDGGKYRGRRQKRTNNSNKYSLKLNSWLRGIEFLLNDEVKGGGDDFLVKETVINSITWICYKINYMLTVITTST